ncbi:gluconate:H+ symporter [Niabella drilacis]|uniref:Gnt-I system high-affinity gluconate transporter n=1 Tax=Niabella drilacis (strain DSM 25811 / CCM 8410 / CCUG 62505 / LMG 26954 / E90) TaxID=1285928 RepID=A0A1G6S8N1_NIADE|nr:gluconate:H+ symporter [Niabella drilacis]SDD12477.1 Gnt-I system high-affinity gluconate transporter [Niabella drilacis]
MALLILILGILLLLLLITAAKLNAFISLIVVALLIGLGNGMEPMQLVTAVNKGIGDTLGSLILVLGLGVLLGALLTETGATQQICNGLIRTFGPARAKIALAITGFAVGLALFYNAGFIVLIPLVFVVAKQTALPLAYLAIAMAAPLSITHGFLPPHPGPTAIAVLFKADLGKTLLYGLCVALPALLLAGMIFPEFIKKIRTAPPPGIFGSEQPMGQSLPGFGISLFTALIPVLLMAASAIASTVDDQTASGLVRVLHFAGDPGMAMLIAVLCALLFLGVFRGTSIKVLMDRTSGSINAIATIVLVIAAGGALKEVLIQSKTADAITHFFLGTSMAPLFLGWLVATLIRIAVGSATVAGLTAAGIVQPLIASMHVKPELMVLSIGAGSLMCSHVNDTGFWMFKEYLGLSIGDTFRTWTVMESIIGIAGLLGVLLLNVLI